MITTVFGPVPSRRLGYSLGVNNIPPKHCTYACVYCQLGKPKRVTANRQDFNNTADILEAVAARMGELENAGTIPDYLTIVPDGEPTVDENLAELIAGLLVHRRPVPNSGTEPASQPRRAPQSTAEPAAPPVPVRGENRRSGPATHSSGAYRPRLAVITNGSLLTDRNVREALCRVDWVSVKVDAPDEALWRRIDRPSRSLDFQDVIDGIRRFRDEYSGFFATETMLIDGLNDGGDDLKSLARLVSGLRPDVAYISIPTRPPSEPWATAPTADNIEFAYRSFLDAGLPAELNIVPEQGAFGTGASPGESILSTAAVHPIPEDALREMLRASGADWDLIEKLLEKGDLLRREYRERVFYRTNLDKGRG